jgi:hypothetical protein
MALNLETYSRLQVRRGLNYSSFSCSFSVWNLNLYEVSRPFTAPPTLIVSVHVTEKNFELVAGKMLNSVLIELINHPDILLLTVPPYNHIYIYIYVIISDKPC